MEQSHTHAHCLQAKEHKYVIHASSHRFIVFISFLFFFRLCTKRTLDVFRCEKFVKNKAEKHCSTFHLYVVNIVLP